MPQSTGGLRLILPDADPAGCVVAPGLRAFIEGAQIQDPTAVGNGGGSDSADPVNYSILAQQIESLTNANTALTERVDLLEELPVPAFGTQNVTNGSTTVNITGVPSAGTRFLTQIVGGKLDNFRVSGESGTVTATWDTAAGSGIYIGWMKI